jgi:hypothetical protein
MEASRHLLGQARPFEAEFGLLSGFGPMESDECQVDLASFEPFAQTLTAAQWIRSPGSRLWRSVTQQGLTVGVSASGVGVLVPKGAFHDRSMR